MMKSPAMDVGWDERTSAPERLLKHSGSVFKTLFERCADAIWLYDPQTARLVDCNQAAVELIGAENKQQLLRTRPEDISPPVQPDGSRTADKTAEILTFTSTTARAWTYWRRPGARTPAAR